MREGSWRKGGDRGGKEGAGEGYVKNVGKGEEDGNGNRNWNGDGDGEKKGEGTGREREGEGNGKGRGREREQRVGGRLRKRLVQHFVACLPVLAISKILPLPSKRQC